MSRMEMEILEELILQLADDYSPEQDSVLLFYIKRAIRSFKKYMNFPKTHTEEQIERETELYHDCIGDLAIYRASKQGMEFVSSFSENGSSQSWQSESEIYALHGIVPYADI